MPRPARLDGEGEWHHVMNRGLARATVFADVSERILFLELLAQAAAKHSTEIHAYCLMDNHYHLLVRSMGRLSHTMQHLSGRYTQIRNARNHRDGPVFRGRYTSVRIGNESHLLQASRYIHLNPVMARLVESPESWQWSSAPAYLGLLAPPDWLVIGEMLSLFGDTAPQAAYRGFLQDGVDIETAKLYAELKY